MEHLGYFQLKASPGVWGLSIASGTRSDMLYRLADKTVSGDYMTSLDVEITSFAGRKISMPVEKRAGMLLQYPFVRTMWRMDRKSR